MWKAVDVGIESLEDIVWVKWLMQPRTCASNGVTTELSAFLQARAWVFLYQNCLSIQRAGKASTLSAIYTHKVYSQ